VPFEEAFRHAKHDFAVVRVKVPAPGEHIETEKDEENDKAERPPESGGIAFLPRKQLFRGAQAYPKDNQENQYPDGPPEAVDSDSQKEKLDLKYPVDQTQHDTQDIRPYENIDDSIEIGNDLPAHSFVR
jgi:hypothetical protein